MPDLRGQFFMETDTSVLGVGATLYQFVDDKLLPLWFLSKKFSTAEVNYSPRDREALAIVWAYDKCRDYLELVPFVLYTDHESSAAFRLQPNLKNTDVMVSITPMPRPSGDYVPLRLPQRWLGERRHEHICPLNLYIGLTGN